MQNRNISEATERQSLQDVLKGLANINLSSKAVYAGQNSLVHPAISTAGEYAVNGVIYAAAASSTVFTLESTTVPIGGATAFVCCLNATGITAGVGYAANVLTSAQVSEAGGTAAGVLASSDLVMPDVPATMTPIAIYTVVAGSVSHVSGSSTFSVITSAGGSHAYTQLLTMAQN